MIVGTCAVCGDPVERLARYARLVHAGSNSWGHEPVLDGP